MSFTTPPSSAPAQALAEPGQMIEFLLPFPTYVVDTEPWPSIKMRVKNLDVEVEKPICHPLEFPIPFAFSNQAADLHCTVVRTFVKDSAGVAIDSLSDVFSGVLSCLQRIRVLGRQYWLLEGSAGVRADYRGSIFSRDQSSVSQMNFVAYSGTVVVKPLTRQIWESIGNDIAKSNPLPLSESIFCDALVSYVTQDPAKCLVELGLAAEIEITQLLDGMSLKQPACATARNYERRKARRADFFGWKLEKGALAFGLRSPATFHEPGMPENWCQGVLRLYKSRSKVAHAGACIVEDEETRAERPLRQGDLEQFICCMEAFFYWSQVQRTGQGLSHPTYTWENYNSKPLLAIRAGTFTGRTNEATTRLE
jgi:hypothetical protein